MKKTLQLTPPLVLVLVCMMIFTGFCGAPLFRALLSGGLMLRSTPMQTAIENRDSAGVESLIRSGSDVNEQDNFGGSALRTALGTNQFDIANTLFKHGADVNAKNDQGKTILQEMIEIGKMKAAVWLREHGARE